jgi:hypothetical protein
MQWLDTARISISEECKAIKWQEKTILILCDEIIGTASGANEQERLFDGAQKFTSPQSPLFCRSKPQTKTVTRPRNENDMKMYPTVARDSYPQKSSFSCSRSQPFPLATLADSTCTKTFDAKMDDYEMGTLTPSTVRRGSAPRAHWRLMSFHISIRPMHAIPLVPWI